MEANLPLVSIIIPTYNRANTIERAIDSALNQTYKNLQLIVVDDGSRDNTSYVLRKYNDTRVEFYKHKVNKGTLAAKNTGLEQIKGEWFTILDSDDEIVPDAIEKLMAVPLFIDNTVTAVSCNCLDTTTNDFSGRGLSKDDYVNLKVLLNCAGEFWGITKTALLQNNRFNENLRGGNEGTLWMKIEERAKRYYIHSALRIYHTEGDDRVSKARFNVKDKIFHFKNLIDEIEYLNILKRYKPDDFHSVCRIGLIIMKASNNKDIASRYFELMDASNRSAAIHLLYRYKFLSVLLVKYATIKSKVKQLLYSRKMA